MAYTPIENSHQEWLGYVQPVGIVVSIPALVAAGASIDRNFVPLHREFLSTLPQDGDGHAIPKLYDFEGFTTNVLDWALSDLSAPDESLTITVPGYEENIHPDYVVKDGGTTILLISKTDVDFDFVPPPEQRKWHASAQVRFERLLRETSIPAGLLVSPDALRIVYAPKGESSGHITFKIADMVQVAGRPILAALHMLLSAHRLFAAADDQRLPAILAASRKHQNVVSNKLSGQVMEALFELLRGFQSAHDQTGLLAEVLRDDPNQVYAGLLTVLLRLVFVLYAEDRDLLSSDEIFVNNYSVNGLFESLRQDEAHNPDTMDQRYGAWARLLVLFRLIFRGARHGGLNIPGRKGYLFDPDRYPFLEGRTDPREQEVQVPRVPDGVLYRVLRNLLLLDGERLSYRNLDVEQIGSVYEAMMGFELHVAQGPSIALKAKKRGGAPITIDLAAIGALSGAKRNEWLSKVADQKVTGKAEKKLFEAANIDDLMAALDGRIAKNVTPTIVLPSAMIFQPSAERRRSGSHYTPRSLTQPIVEAALAPVLKELGDNPKPEQILALKVCDPAMGSGAFLVEACRQLGDALVVTWHKHEATPVLPPDEDELLHARRLVAQRCLYGIDKNEMAVDLAKLSLWLATLARDHEFTFLDHALRHGDSLLGVTARQIAAFDWEPNPSLSFLEGELRRRITHASKARKEILDSREGTPYAQLAQQLAVAEEQLGLVRNVGDVLVGAFFAGKTKATRRTAKKLRQEKVQAAFGNPPDFAIGVELSKIAEKQRSGAKPLVPFHWGLEFPEVFALNSALQSEGGFDVIVGNPPFAGKNTIINGSPDGYIEWLKELHPESHGNADLVAHFFRRAFDALRPDGCFGLIATNTVAQGDTRSTGLRWINMHDGAIYRAIKRYKWPGEAAVVVSILHVIKGDPGFPRLLDGQVVSIITAFLFHRGGNTDPERLEENRGRSFEGVKVYGMGFTFDDEDAKHIASSLGEMKELIQKDPANAERIFPYIGGEEINDGAIQSPKRFVIDFADWPVRRQFMDQSWEGSSETVRRSYLQAGYVPSDYPGPVAADYPELLAVIERKVKPERDKDNRENYRRIWWQFGERRPGLIRQMANTTHSLVTSRVTQNLSFVFISNRIIPSDRLTVIPGAGITLFGILQSRLHELWARFFGSTLEDRLLYAPLDCFETFPFPGNLEGNGDFEAISRKYYDFRAAVMLRSNEGLTKTYNRFHRPDEYSPDIVELRRAHDQIDHAVLKAYGWHDLRGTPDFFPEFDEEDEEEDGRTNRAKPKKYRYRWPDEIHDEVLARLLALNLERAALQGPAETKDSGKPKRGKVRVKARTNDEPVLF
jgi:hypothetical protein